MPSHGHLRPVSSDVAPSAINNEMDICFIQKQKTAGVTK